MFDIIFIMLIVLLASLGAKRGLVKTLMGLASTALSLIVSVVFYRPVSLALTSSPLGEAVREYIEKLAAEKMGNIPIALLGNGIELSSQLVIDAISFSVVIILSKIIITVLTGVLGIISKLPVIKQANSLLGMLAGILSGAFICYIAVGIITVAAESGSLTDIAQMMDKSLIAAILSENNIIVNVLS